MLTCPVTKKVSLPLAKLASVRARFLSPSPSVAYAWTLASRQTRGFSSSRADSQHFRRFISQRNWQHVLHYERSKALPSEWVIRAPRSSSQNPSLRTSQNNYLLYDPATYKLRGLDFPPAPEHGIAPMKFYYQVLTTPTGDTPGTTVLLHFPDKRYFLGQIAEGTQRACTERGVKLTYLTDVFLTGRTEWANTGGLIGTILTQADGLASSAQALEETQQQQQQQRGGQAVTGTEGKRHGAAYAVHGGQTVAQRGTLTVHGGRNLSHTLATARRFVFRQGMPVFMREYDSADRSLGGEVEDPFEEPSWADNNIKMWAIPVKSAEPATAEPATAGSGAASPRKRSLDEFQENQNEGKENQGKEDQNEKELDRRTREQVMRQAVVSDMFNSTWRMDALVEVPLAQVNMPAAIFIRNPETKRIEKYTGPAPGTDSDEPLPDIKVLVRQPWPGATVEKLPPTTRCDEALSYVVRNHDIRGKFDPKKAQALKVRKGPDYAALTKGESVQSEDGVTVTPEMVLGPARPGKGLAIIDLPTPEYVDDFVARGEWASPAVTTGLEAFLWILGPGVGDHPKLREFVARMSQCKHMVSSTDYCPNYLALGSVAESSIRLASIKGDSYAVPVHDNETLPQPGTSSTTTTGSSTTTQETPFEPAEPGLLINMEPTFEVNRDEVMRRLNPSKTVQTMPRSVEKRLSTIRRRMNKPAFTARLQKYRENLPGQDVEIIALGTGSSSPSKYRNVSGTLVHVPGVGYYLLDCGENTLGQLRRVFTPDQLRDILRNLRMIWISHLHADHHLGTASVIRAWYRENYPDGVPQDDPYIEDDLEKILDSANGGEKRLFVASEEMMIGWLEEYAAIEDYGFARTIPLVTNPYIDLANPALRVQTMFAYRHCRSNGSYPGSRHDVGKPSTTHFRFNEPSSPSLSAKLRKATGLSDLRATRVPHCRGALAVSLVFPDGFQLSFSGDCRPSKSFVEIGRGSTVLIHEATFQDDMQDSAMAKRHSTSGEALEVGRLMGARAILLTHFSQRYQKVAYVEAKGESTQSETQTRNQDAAQNPGPDVDADADADADADQGAEGQGSGQTLSFKDQLVVPPGRPQRGNAPATAMFDYMRIRVGDVPIAQEYAPALEKLFDMLERAASEEAEAARRERQVVEAEAAKKKRAGKPKAGHNQNGQADKAPVEAAQEERTEKKSAWSASESEDGWSTDE